MSEGLSKVVHNIDQFSDTVLSLAYKKVANRVKPVATTLSVS